MPARLTFHNTTWHAPARRDQAGDHTDSCRESRRLEYGRHNGARDIIAGAFKEAGAPTKVEARMGDLGAQARSRARARRLSPRTGGWTSRYPKH